MKLILLFGLLFMVSCDQAALEEALMAESGDTVEKAVLDLPPVGVEIFDSFDSSQNPNFFLSDNNSYERCDLDSSGLWRNTVIHTSQADGAKPNQVNFSILVRYSHGSCLGIMEHYHGYMMRLTIDEGRVYASEFSVHLVQEGEEFADEDDCDYTKSIIDSGCFHDFKSFQHDLYIIDEETISLDGQIYRD